MNPMVEVKVRVYADRDELHVWMTGEEIANESSGSYLAHQLNPDGVVMGFVLWRLSQWSVDGWFNCDERQTLPVHLRHPADRWFLERQRLERRTERNREYFRKSRGNGSSRPPVRFFDVQPIERRGGRTRYAVHQRIRRARQ